MKKLLKVLYFLNGPIPTEDDEAEMSKFNANHRVCQRNARLVQPTDSVEDFDRVAGAVPSQYAEAAEAKGEPVEAIVPKVPVADVPQGSPLAPATDAGAGDAGKPASAPQDAASGDAKPKPPEAKPDAGKSWKPNA